MRVNNLNYAQLYLVVERFWSKWWLSTGESS